MKVTVDSAELRQYELVLGLAAEEVLPEARKVVAKGALNIKNGARRRAPKGPHTPHYERSISYDITETKTEVRAEIGPAHGKPQANLGHVFEDGSPTSPPHPHHAPAGDEEEPKFVSAMENLRRSC